MVCEIWQFIAHILESPRNIRGEGDIINLTILRLLPHLPHNDTLFKII